MYSQLLLLMLSMVNTNLTIDYDLKTSLNDFSIDFLKSYHQLGDKNTNLFYSSISLASTLSLLVSGSDGETKHQLIDLLGYSNLVHNYTLEIAFKKLNEELKLHDFSNDHLLFKMINRIYLKNNSRLLDDFRLIAKKSYDTDLLESDFKKDSKQLIHKINKWIEYETKDLIKDVVKEIDSETAMLLINVVYFKAKWLKPFSKASVHPRQFTNLDGVKTKVSSMSDVDHYSYGQFEQYRILQLNYIGNCSFYIVLPNEDINLHDLLHNLDTKKLNDDLKELKITHLDIQIPKFSFTSDINLKSVLQQLGIKLLFNEGANLSKISNETNLLVSEAWQNAFINVDEDGTEAAAATIFKMMPRSMFVGEEFHVNRPFIFVIRLNDVNIFVGALKKF